MTTTTKTKAEDNGSAPVEPALTAEFVAKTIDIDTVRATFGEMLDAETALASIGLSMTPMAAGMATAWVAMRRVLPDVTITEIRDMPVDIFGSLVDKGKGAGKAQG